jgi:lipid A 4'-phosphatase
LIYNLSYRFIGFTAACVLFFLFFPRLDIAFTNIFYHNGEFFMSRYSWIKFFYDTAQIISGVVGGVLIVTYAVLKIYCPKPETNSSAKKAKKLTLFLLIALISGPVLSVNFVLKEHMGRARPSEIREFGGEKKFFGAWKVSDQTMSNGSFVSGHAAAAFYFTAFSLCFAAGRKRDIAFWSAVCYGGLVGMGRVAQGRHFLSDILFAFIVVYVVNKIVHYMMFKEKDGFP